jgi:hypothetical protein
LNVDYEFYAKRKKLPPCATQILQGKVSMFIGSNGRQLLSATGEVPDGFWMPKSKDGTQ